MFYPSKKKIIGGLVSATLALLVTIVALDAQADQPSSVTVESIQQSSFGELSGSPFLFDSNFTSPTLGTDEKFNVVGFKWAGTGAISFQVQILQKDGWSDWQDVPEMEDLYGKGDLEYKFSDLLFVNSTNQLRYRYESTGEIEEIELITLGSIKDKSAFGFLSDWLQALVPKAEADVSIISRAEWGADEDITFWEPEYAQPEKFIIHHTAGGDGDVDPESSLRAIQYWHAVVLGWGDIGYNYLIDTNGNVYEGRKGEDGVIAAHAYRAKTCNRERFGGANEGVDFNRGTIGISIMGNYEEGDVSDEAFEAAAKLIADKAETFGITPTGTSDFRDLDDMPNVAGHIDVDCTLCPGANLYDRLPELRTLSQSYMGQAQLTYRSRFLSASAESIELATGATKKITARFKNTGTATWYKNNKAPTLVTETQPSSLKTNNWLSSYRVAKQTANTVNPGETATFEFYIEAPEDELEIDEVFRLAHNHLPLLNTDFDLHVDVTGLSWAARLTSHTINEASFLDASLPVTVTYENVGTQTWTKDNVKLEIYDLGYSVSRYHDSSWPNKYGQISLDQNRVKPGETGTFTFYEKSPTSPGYYKQILALKQNGSEIINSESSLVTRVDSMYKARLISSDIPLAMLYNWQPEVTLRFKNTGVATWDGNVQLSVFDLGGERSKFYHSSWPSAQGNIRLNESTVKSGEVGSFTLKLDAPDIHGLYKHVIIIDAQNYPYQMQGGSVVRLTRVD